MKRCGFFVCVCGCLGLLAGSTHAADVEVELLIDGFDGCGCLPPFDDPISCPPCPDGVFNGFPNPDVLGGGDGNCEIDWLARGYAADFSADFSVVDQGFAAQKMVIGNPLFPVTQTPFGSGDFIAISHNNPDDTCCPPFNIGAVKFEEKRIAQGLPPAKPGTGSRIVAAFRRFGTGFCVTSHADTIFNPSSLQPNTLGFSTPAAATRVIADDATYHDISVLEFDGFPESLQMGFRISLGPESCTPISIVNFHLDNARLIYTADVPDTETDCGDGIDNDLDGLIDCLDSDCSATQACTGCAHDPVYDVDDDGDVDHEDFGIFQTCFTGTGDPGGVFAGLSEDCRCMDTTGPGNAPDNAVDQQDFGKFQACATGPEPAAPALLSCDD